MNLLLRFSGLVASYCRVQNCSQDRETWEKRNLRKFIMNIFLLSLDNKPVLKQAYVWYGNYWQEEITSLSFHQLSLLGPIQAEHILAFPSYRFYEH